MLENIAAEISVTIVPAFPPKNFILSLVKPIADDDAIVEKANMESHAEGESCNCTLCSGLALLGLEIFSFIVRVGVSPTTCTTVGVGVIVVRTLLESDGCRKFFTAK